MKYTTFVLSLLCLAFDVLSGAFMCVCAQLIGTFSAFLWADSVSGTMLVFGSTMQREQSAGVCMCRISSLSFFRSTLGSFEGLNIPTADDEENNEEEKSSVLSEGIVHSNILAYLSGTSSSSRQRQWTPERSVLLY